VVQLGEELVLADSDKVKTTFLFTIPAEEDKLFDCHMRHDGRSVGWDRAGYGSKSIVMEPGYDSTWACLLHMGTTGSRLMPELRTPKDTGRRGVGCPNRASPGSRGPSVCQQGVGQNAGVAAPGTSLVGDCR